MAWSGIMGFSDDELPWVGMVPESVGGGQGQWICAGYTGNGTDLFAFDFNLRLVKCPALRRSGS